MDRKIVQNFNLALQECEKALKLREVPVGAVIINKDGKCLARAHNIKESTFDPCGHAEIIAIRKATKKIKNWRLTDCELFITLEPCVMCLAACIHSRIKKVYYGAQDKKAGSVSLNFKLESDKRLNHQLELIYEPIEKCSKILSHFFKQKRKENRERKL